MTGHVVTVLKAQVKVLRKDAAGNQIMEPTGDFTTAGTPVLRAAVRPVTVRKDELLPPGLADGEVERLQKLGVIREKSAVAAVSETPAAEEPKPARKPRAKKAAIVAPSGGLDLDNLADATDDELLAGIGQVGETALIAAVGADAALATRVLAAESLATKQDPRAGLVTELDKVIAASETPAA